MKQLIITATIFTVSVAIGATDTDFQLQAGTTVSLFAQEPDVQDPSAMDVDAHGRVWVTEIVNYRKQNGLRPEGDRIVVLEDQNGDGKSDKTTVFYQAKDFVSPHGICVIAEGKAIVSVDDKVIILTDLDGDLKADKKEVLFSQVARKQHDHGIHAFVQGPDGRLYFNFGNAGTQIADKDGNVITDKSGRTVNTKTAPYKQGMVFRCNEDGSQLETLAWNFRNNWDLAVDSYGSIWQSDNDDDGNKGCHVNFVMEFGDYGYRSQITGGGWNAYRHSRHQDRGYYHFHQNDPGVIPYLYHYGAGGPTGIIAYEGSLLPKAMQNQVIHCEPRDLSVRSYPRQNSGAGYTATMENVLRTNKFNMFRPSDVVTAPDGSIFVADWHDGGVGGHGARSLKTGRIYRIATPDTANSYKPEKPDFTTPTGAVKALTNPNKAVQYQAHRSLVKMGKSAESAVLELYAKGAPINQARALWVLAQLSPKKAVERGLQSSNHDLRIVAIRAARQHNLATAAFLKTVVRDPHPQVRREVCIAVRELNATEAPALWAELALQLRDTDRWYVEALGLAADYRWDACLDAWLARNPDPKSAAYLEILWRSRSAKHTQRIIALINDPAQSPTQIRRLFRAIDFQPKESDFGALYQQLTDQGHPQQELIDGLILRSLERIDVKKFPKLASLVENKMDKLKGTTAYVDLVVDGRLRNAYPGLLEMASKAQYQEVAAYAAAGYARLGEHRRLKTQIGDLNETELLRLVYALGSSGERDAYRGLINLLEADELPLAIVRACAEVLAEDNNGSREAAKLALRKNHFSAKVQSIIVQTVARSRHSRARDAIKPLVQKQNTVQSKHNVEALMKQHGDATKGEALFSAYCMGCHTNGKIGFEYGPGLQDIGKKLGRDVIYQAIIDPSAAISFDYVGTKLYMKDRSEVVGIITGETETHATVKLMGGSSIQYELTKIAKRQTLKDSLMPKLAEAMTTTQLVDLVEYLTTLK